MPSVMNQVLTRHDASKLSVKYLLVSDGLENRLQRCYPTSSHVTVGKNVVLTLFISLSILIQQEINHFNTSALQAQVLLNVDLISTFEFHYLAIECSLNSVQLFTLMKKLFLWFNLNKWCCRRG